MVRSLTALACVAALAVASGCGESDQEQAREVVQDYVQARADQDSERVCELFSESFKQELAVEDCAGFVQEQSSGADGSEELEVVDVRVNGDKATANIDVTRGSEGGPTRIGLLLEREDDEWRITGFQ